jgi:hypothetical protein
VCKGAPRRQTATSGGRCRVLGVPSDTLDRRLRSCPRQFAISEPAVAELGKAGCRVFLITGHRWIPACQRLMTMAVAAGIMKNRLGMIEVSMLSLLESLSMPSWPCFQRTAQHMRYGQQRMKKPAYSVLIPARLLHCFRSEQRYFVRPATFRRFSSGCVLSSVCAASS